MQCALPADPTAAMVSNADVAALATVQSHCQPARSSGVDWDKNFAVWVQVRGDGDYIYNPDFSHAVPVTEQNLSERIDRLYCRGCHSTAATPRNVVCCHHGAPVPLSGRG